MVVAADKGIVKEGCNEQRRSDDWKCGIMNKEGQTIGS